MRFLIKLTVLASDLKSLTTETRLAVLAIWFSSVWKMSLPTPTANMVMPSALARLAWKINVYKKK